MIDELEIQIIGLQGKIERLEKQLKKQKTEFLQDLTDLEGSCSTNCTIFKDKREKWEAK